MTHSKYDKRTLLKIALVLLAVILMATFCIALTLEKPPTVLFALTFASALQLYAIIQILVSRNRIS